MNCKVGDMAEIISGINNGAIVEVVSTDELMTHRFGERYWNVHAPWPLVVIGGKYRGQHYNDVSAPDKYLRPIRPKQPETTKEKEKETT